VIKKGELSAIGFILFVYSEVKIVQAIAGKGSFLFGAIIFSISIGFALMGYLKK